MALATQGLLCEECKASRLKFPRTHPDYLIEEWIGGGGMGEVFRARQLSRGRPVAIKMISANNALGEKASGYFRREIEVLRDLLMPGGQCHPSIVAFYEIYEVESSDSTGDGVCRRHERARLDQWVGAARCRWPAAR